MARSNLSSFHAPRGSLSSFPRSAWERNPVLVPMLRVGTQSPAALRPADCTAADVDLIIDAEGIKGRGYEPQNLDKVGCVLARTIISFFSVNGIWSCVQAHTLPTKRAGGEGKLETSIALPVTLAKARCRPSHKKVVQSG